MINLPDLFDTIRTTMDGHNVDDHGHSNYLKMKILLYDFYVHGCLVGSSTKYTQSNVVLEFEEKFKETMSCKKEKK